MNGPRNQRLPPFELIATGTPSMLLGLDFDGTLSPITESPDLSRLPSRTHKVLCSLARRPGVTVAIISGRALDDLRTLVAIDDLVYAGNHGLEISGPGFRFVEAHAVGEMELMARLAKSLTAHLQPITGALVEDKGLTLSVHVRKVAPTDVPGVLRIVQEAMSECAGRVRLGRGLKVFEIRPCVSWNKGSALHWIRDRLNVPEPSVLYIGDDRTDEDVFSVLRQGTTVKVGQPAGTAADYYVDSPDDVLDLLCWLDRARAANPAYDTRAPDGLPSDHNRTT